MEALTNFLVKLPFGADADRARGRVGPDRARAGARVRRRRRGRASSRSGGRALGRADARAVGRGAGGRRRTDQPRRPHRRLPLHRRQPARDHGLAARVDARARARRSSALSDPPQGVAAVEHGDDLRRHLRASRTTSARRDRRQRAGAAGHVAVLDRRRPRLGGGGRGRAGADRADALGDGHEPGPRRRLRHALHARPPRPRRPRAASGRQYVSWIHEQDFAAADRGC